MSLEADPFPDAGLFGPKGTTEFARSKDWRTEADRILAQFKPLD